MGERHTAGALDRTLYLAHDLPQICRAALPRFLIGSNMHMLWEGGKTRMVPRIIPAVAGFPLWRLPVVTILQTAHSITPQLFYSHILGKEKGGTVDQVYDTLQVSNIDVLFVKFDTLACDYPRGCKELQD